VLLFRWMTVCEQVNHPGI